MIHDWISHSGLFLHSYESEKRFYSPDRGDGDIIVAMRFFLFVPLVISLLNQSCEAKSSPARIANMEFAGSMEGSV